MLVSSTARRLRTERSHHPAHTAPTQPACHLMPPPHLRTNIDSLASLNSVAFLANKRSSRSSAQLIPHIRGQINYPNKVRTI
ncbi:hypothetical protein M408DRAFT_242755 [Serendipita vermifera MAFF 305830]|uniref:Uncharacterized protein n=1 Tax=Serendipita vermifera MAFF 305830 TaxID=933852 RepID=A0A0C2WCM1_SERVB|nr:hypothetical protein M408DRAFT_242755 [Serendipita vermifera MAFF 305830]